MQNLPIGKVLGTEEATPLQFWFWVDPDSSVHLDDLVVLETQKPDGKAVKYFGVVDQVRKIHEGVTFESDVQSVMDGILPAQVSYSAHVLVTRVDPEEFIPPHPGDPVRKAQGAELEKALYQDAMNSKLPAGVLRSGAAVSLNFAFVNGENGAHVNISGVSGVATKTSYALFLLYSIFNSAALGAERSNSKAVIFNVKGEDLMFLDKPNCRFAEKEGKVQNSSGFQTDRYQICELPKHPFTDVQFLAPPKTVTDRSVIIPDLEQRKEGVTPYLWTLRDFCLGRMLPYCFADKDSSVNLGFLIGGLEDKLHKLALNQPDQPHLAVDDWKLEDGGAELDFDIQFDTMGKTLLKTFEQLIGYLEFKLLGQDGEGGDRRWQAQQNTGTLQAFIRRLRGVAKHLSPLIRGDLSKEQARKFKPNLLRADKQLSVVDIHRLNSYAQMFVVGVMLRDLFDAKEKQGRTPYVFVVLDELNKYAPREGISPIKDVLLDIAERGRSLGIILIGAQQTASEVERRIVGNASIRVVGRLDAAEAERPEYRFLPAAYRLRASILQPGTMIVQQPEVPTPVMVTFPFPAWATRADEIEGKSALEQEQDAESWLS